MFDFAPDAIAPIAPMVFDSNNPTAWDRSPTGVAGVETIPTFAHSFGRDLLARILPPLVAVTSVIAIWWSLYLIYPRLLPSPVSTVNEALRRHVLLSHVSKLAPRLCRHHRRHVF
jgi:hypothetical protein